MGRKYTVLLYTFVLLSIVTYMLIIPFVSYMFNGTLDPDVLKEILERIIDPNLTYQDLIQDNDLLVYAWNIN